MKTGGIRIQLRKTLKTVAIDLYSSLKALVFNTLKDFHGFKIHYLLNSFPNLYSLIFWQVFIFKFGQSGFALYNCFEFIY